MPVNASFGVFPAQSAVRSQSCNDLQRLYFRTQNKSEHDWRTIPEADRPENFDAIHNIGKRTTRYMKFQKKVAPLVDRTATGYFKEFNAKPLGDCATNRELAKTFKGVSKTASSPSFGIKSNYKETFLDCEPHQRKNAKQKTCAPKYGLTKTLGGTDDFMEPMSNTHRSHPIHPMELARAAPAMIPKPNLTMSSMNVGEAYRSQYHRDFANAHSVAAPDAKWEDYMPAPSPFTLADDSIYRVRRACFLSPGA